MEAMSEEIKRRAAAVEFAGFWIRLGAYLVDVLILHLVYSIIGLGFWLSALGSSAYFMHLGSNSYGDVFTNSIAYIWLWGFIALAIAIAYFAGFWQWRGQTPGKIALGIKVIHTDGSSLNWGWALLRYLGYIVSTMTIYIGFIWIAFDSRKQGLHDKIADTYVIKLPRRRVMLPEVYAEA